MSYLSLDGGGYSDWNGRPAINLIIRDYSNDIERVFAYVDGDYSRATWAFDLTPPNDNYDELYPGTNAVKNLRAGGYSFSPGSKYKIDAKGYNSRGEVACWSNTLVVTIPELEPSKCPGVWLWVEDVGPRIVAKIKNYDPRFILKCRYSYETDEDANFINWHWGTSVLKSNIPKERDDYPIRFEAWTEKSGWEPSNKDWGQLTINLRPRRPSLFGGFNYNRDDVPEYTKINSSTIWSYMVQASEWNAFCKYINDMREYWGLTETILNKVSRGDTITASIFNDAVIAIQPIDSSLETVRQGDSIAAEHFQNLKRTLNRAYR